MSGWLRLFSSTDILTGVIAGLAAGWCMRAWWRAWRAHQQMLDRKLRNHVNKTYGGGGGK